MAHDKKRKKTDRARLVSVKVLYQVTEENVFSNESAAYHLSTSGLDARDRSFASAIIYGTLSRLPLIDYYLSRASKRSPDKLDPWVRTILRAGIWQLYFSYQVTTAAACDESVHLARQLAGEKTTGFVNGVMRQLARERPTLPEKGAQALEVGLPQDLFNLMTEWYGHDIAKLIGEAALTSPDAVPIRPNLCLESSFECWSQGDEAARFQLIKLPWPSKAFGVSPGGQSVTAMDAYRDGFFTIQSQSAMLAGHLAGAKKGDRVLDLCAAPGGKASHIAELTGRDCELLACDVSSERLTLLDQTLKRLGHSFIETRLHDATVFESQFEKAFDLVLCDVPCSGLGLLQKRPEIRSRMTRAAINRIIVTQNAILENGARAVAPGGTLLYTTCTINPEENETRVNLFLDSDIGRDFVLDDLRDDLAVALKDDIPLPLSTRLPQTVQVMSYRDGSDGFYIARLRRRGL
ncbi:MAG: 16S rRNA (cytosine(967)-C(5))-methyltransferase RsmB [Clostridiaceae bacterium]|nr:16S rRNA (cytosine(967)-C(5))-methyltransferase RsmB [Clostridiaceae bacterium]